MTSTPRPYGPGERFHKPAIAVFAFKRADLLRRTLRSLERAQGFGGFKVHVFSDAPRNEYPAEIDAVRRVRSVLRPWCSRHNAILHEATHNLGLRSSIVGGVTRVLEEYEAVIVLEDDLILSKCFLEFMEQALAACRPRNDIMQISGYFVPHNTDLPPVGLIRTPGSWGWATWRRAWTCYEDDAVKLVRDVSRRDPEEFDLRGSYAFFDELKKNAEGHLDTWAVRWYASMFLKGGLALYPARSMTRNIGFRGDATNTSPSPTATTYLDQRIARKLPAIDWSQVGSGETDAFAAALQKFYRWQNAKWVRPTLRERIAARWKILTGGDASA